MRPHLDKWPDPVDGQSPVERRSRGLWLGCEAVGQNLEAPWLIPDHGQIPHDSSIGGVKASATVGTSGGT